MTGETWTTAKRRVRDGMKVVERLDEQAALMIPCGAVGRVRTPIRTAASTAAAAAVAFGALLATPASGAVADEVGAPTKERAWVAEILYPVAARTGPSPRARVKEQVLHYTAYSRRRQVLLVTGAHTEPGGRRWVRVELPTRPNQNMGWVPADAVRLSSTGLRFRVSIARRVLEVWRDGKLTRTIKVAVGAPNTPTSTGLFAVADPVKSNGHLGPHIIVLTAYSRVYHEFLGGPGVHAIHGWGDAGAFGRAVSNGCVRTSRRDVAWIARIAKPGTPVEITRS
ncbi:MAG: L,D-transpeptidase [Actinomycetota bacterium]